jgi:hypothetical protein
MILDKWQIDENTVLAEDEITGHSFTVSDLIYAVECRCSPTPTAEVNRLRKEIAEALYRNQEADKEIARLRAGVGQFAAAMREPNWAWDEMTDAQQAAYNALMEL